MTLRKEPRPKLTHKQRAAWKAEEPELLELVNEETPRVLDALHERALSKVPEAWHALVATMHDEALAEADNVSAPTKEAAAPPSLPVRRGKAWATQILGVAAMIEVLLETIRDDIGFERGSGTIASMILVREAFDHLATELSEPSNELDSEETDDGDLEGRYRRVRALEALLPKLDDIHMRRFRAANRAPLCAQFARPLATEAEVRKSFEDLKACVNLKPEVDLNRHREYRTITEPALSGVLARSWLMEMDERFGSLEPAVVYEEFSEAEAGSRGGKNDAGEGRVGPLRALARLALMAGALGYEQDPGEEFDAAVERVRSNLIMTRSRVRKVVRDFLVRVAPREVEEEPEGDDGAADGSTDRST